MESELCTIRPTLNSGRGVFASRYIPANTPLLSTSSIAASVVHRQYRREVCAWCFAYDRGKSWPVRDSAVGLVWCTESCQREWHGSVGEVGYEAFEIVEEIVRKARKDGEDEEMFDVAELLHKPCPEDIKTAWEDAERKGQDVLAARTSATPTKKERKALFDTATGHIDHSVLYYKLSGILSSAADSQEWKELQDLIQSDCPYLLRFFLDHHIDAYLRLLSVLPFALLLHVTPNNLHGLISRDAHNAFGIRSLDDGSELLGHGIWPEASYWNHSCDPNVGKERNGRTRDFWALRDVAEGEELCITYLGGEEKTLGVDTRRKKLKDEWGFDCQCTKCQQDLTSSSQQT